MTAKRSSEKAAAGAGAGAGKKQRRVVLSLTKLNSLTPEGRQRLAKATRDPKLGRSRKFPTLRSTD